MGLQNGKGWLLRLCSWEPGWLRLTAGACMLLHGLAVLHKSRKQLLLLSVLGHGGALSLGALGAALLSLALAASDESHNTHPTLLHWPQLFSPDLTCTCPVAHPAWLSISLVTKADIRSVSFSSLSSFWLWGSSLLHYLRCRSAKARNEGGLHSKRAISFPWKVCTILTTRVCFLLQTNNFHDTWYV